jgi:cold shock CspA family protein
MTNYGKITHFDKHTGTGLIAPMDGSDAVPFMASGMAQQPRSDETYTFDTQRGADGRPQAVNLQMDTGPDARQQHAQAHGNEGGFDAQGQSQQRHNQEAERRSGVDGAGEVHGGGEARDSHGRTEHQTRTDGQEGVSRAGMDTARGNAAGETYPERGGSSAGGSTFQPLEAEESKAARSPEREHELGRDPQGRDERAIKEQRRDDRRT